MTPRPGPSARLWLLFLCLAAVWGSSFLFIKIGLEEGLEPFTLVTYRLLVASVFLFLVGRITGARWPRDVRGLATVGVLGVINVAVPFSLITWGEQYISSALASILNGLAPLFTIVFAAIALRDEPIRLNRLVGLLVGFVGAVVLLSPGLSASSATSTGQEWMGELALVLACVSYAAAGVFVRAAITGRPLIDDPATGPRAPRPVEIALPQNLAGAVIVTLLAVLVERPAGGLLATPATGQALLAVTWLGLLGSGVSYLLFFRIIGAWGATRASLVTYVMPIVGIALGIAVLGERLDPAEIVGTILVIGGLVVANSRIGQRRLLGRAPAETATTT